MQKTEMMRVSERSWLIAQKTRRKRETSNIVSKLKKLFSSLSNRCCCCCCCSTSTRSRLRLNLKFLMDMKKANEKHKPIFFFRQIFFKNAKKSGGCFSAKRAQIANFSIRHKILKFQQIMFHCSCTKNQLRFCSTRDSGLSWYQVGQYQSSAPSTDKLPRFKPVAAG